MFPRTWAVKPKDLDLADPKAVIEFLETTLQKELTGRRLFTFSFFVDVDQELKKIVYYDMSVVEHVIEFSSIFARLPEYSIDCAGKEVKIYHFDPESAVARVLILDTIAPDGKDEIHKVWVSQERSEEETKSLKAVASTTHGFIEVACDLAGIVNASVVENAETKEKRAFFSVKLDAPSDKNLAIIRSCEKMHFAWSDQETSYMVFLCRFRMLPPFALSFPIMGRNMEDAMTLYTKSKQAVGVVIFTDDVNDSFTIAEEKPTFE
jgi:hypothetical protein